jgi:glycosyltransferase involved in cell wall biosynthesis
LKVLYLVPPVKRADQLTPHSFLDEEIEGIAETGVEVYVLSTGIERPERRGRVNLVPVPAGRWPDRLRALRFLARHPRAAHRGWPRYLGKTVHAVRLELHAARVVRDFGIDVIHSHFGCAYGLGGILARRETGRPLVTSFRGMDLLLDDSVKYGLRRERFYDSAVRRLLPHADISTYASDYMRAHAVRMGAPESTAVTIRKGVDLDHFSWRDDAETLRRDLGIRSPMILTVAGLIKRKGVDVILRALARLSAEFDFQFVVCGEGREAAALKRLSSQLGLADRVRFVGQVSRREIPKYFAACDVFVLASHMEAAGNVLLEAMASGRPVVCTDSGGPPEYVRDGVTGVVVPPGDAAAMAGALGRLLADPRLRSRMGRSGREIAEREHRYDRMVAEYLEVYRRALSPGSARVDRSRSAVV